MEHKIKVSPMDFFIYLGSIVFLYASAISLLNLLFAVINYAYPDVLNYISPDNSSFSAAMATLIIIFPLYIFLSFYLSRDLEKNPEKKELRIRKWLVYFTLFAAGITIASDLVVLINTYLNGEITTRFILKVLAVLITAALVFAYYGFGLKKQEKYNYGKIFGIISGILVLGSIVSGFLIIGSPATQRALRFDSQRVSDLQNIQWQVINYYQQKSELPTTLTDLNNPLSGFSLPIDPEGKPYGYQNPGNLSFSLCADFSLASRADSLQGISVSVPAGVPVGSSQVDNWSHPAGAYCFIRTIDPDLYPPFKKQ